MALINMDDLIYPLGKFNYDIIILTQIGFLITVTLYYSYKHFIAFDKYINLITSKLIWFRRNYRILKPYIKQKWLHFTIGILLVGIINGIFYLIINNPDYKNALLILTPAIIYIPFIRHREGLVVVLILNVFIGVKFIREGIESSFTNKKNKSVRTLVYINDSLVNKTKDEFLLYNGYKSTIIQNVKTKVINVYPSENVTRITVE